MTDKPRKWLITSLRKHLVPAFEENGFKCLPLSAEEAASGENRRALPLGHLRRESTRGIDLVEIQLCKYRPAFRLSFGVAPSEGIEHPLGHVAQEDILPGHLSTFYHVYKWPRFRRYFLVSRWFGPPLTKVDYEQLVVDHLGIVQEVEDVLQHRKLGRHIRKIDTW